MKRKLCICFAILIILTSCSLNNASEPKVISNEDKKVEIEQEVEEVEDMTKETTEQLVEKMLEPIYLNYPTENIVEEQDFWDVYIDEKHRNPIFLNDVKYEVEKNSGYIVTNVSATSSSYENSDGTLFIQERFFKDIREQQLSIYDYIEEMPMNFPFYEPPFQLTGVQRKSYDILCSGRLISARNKDTQEQVSMDEVLFSTYMYSETEEIDKNNLEAYKHGSMDFYMDSYYWGSQKSPKTLMNLPNVVKQMEYSKLDLDKTKIMLLTNSILPGNNAVNVVLLFDGEYEYILPFYDYKYDISSFNEELAEKVERKYFDDEGNSYHMYLKGETLYEFNDEMLDDLIFFHYDMKSDK